MGFVTIETVEPTKVNEGAPESLDSFGSVHTSRFFYFALGQVLLKAPVHVANPDTRVVASLAEVNPNTLKPVLGRARMSVHNIVSEQNFITTWVNVESSQPVPVALTLMYTNP
ncbi:hypothetical protein [Nonomuraea africana]|uniref:Uncharacterized protein n=1 Tax=Nonomuraea africana TaxID=46171 RepID=A0ABR9KI16_9ACTN|nr:hypothetical protein [Nonomuraea africana]MBE1561669.1 hypothetical protein [Nonomuraea africana]